MGILIAELTISVKNNKGYFCAQVYLQTGIFNINDDRQSHSNTINRTGRLYMARATINSRFAIKHCCKLSNANGVKDK